LYLQKTNFGQAQYRPPDDGPHVPKLLVVVVNKCFNENFNKFISYMLDKRAFVGERILAKR